MVHSPRSRLSVSLASNCPLRALLTRMSCETTTALQISYPLRVGTFQKPGSRATKVASTPASTSATRKRPPVLTFDDLAISICAFGIECAVATSRKLDAAKHEVESRTMFARCNSRWRRSRRRHPNRAERRPKITWVELAPTQDWIDVTTSSISPTALIEWATRPECGAVVTFCGTVRRTSTTHDNVEALEYETDEAVARQRMAQIVATVRRRWPMTEAVALHHRVGRVELGETAVVVAVSSPHRQEAFEAAQFCIDTLKASVPLWKREIWAEGSAWSSDAKAMTEVPK
jgi:molybdopterin synthase catalytic subunit